MLAQSSGIGGLYRLPIAIAVADMIFPFALGRLPRPAIDATTGPRTVHERIGDAP
jgi:hypothetical protein